MNRLVLSFCVFVLPFLMFFSLNAQPGPGQSVQQGLKIEDIKVGSGKAAKAGDRLVVHYRGKLENGMQFDSSIDRGAPFEFHLGVGQVISGWDQGVVGMKKGGKRNLVIPPSVGYGDRDLGVIPPNSTLLFEVELIEIK